MNLATHDEDRMATIAIVKTVDFLYGNLFVAFFVVLLAHVEGASSLLTELEWGSDSTWPAWVFVVAIVELLLLVGAIRMQSSYSYDRVPAVSETQAATVLSALAFVPWMFAIDPASFRIFNWVVDGSLFVVTLVFFIAKSVASRRLRYRVLAVTAVPVVNLIVGIAWSRT